VVVVVVVGRGISTKPGELAAAVAGGGAISTKPGGSAGGGGRSWYLDEAR